MERKKRVSVGVVLMGFFLIFVVLFGVVALILHELAIAGEADFGGDAFEVTGFLHTLLGIGLRSGNLSEAIAAAPRDYAAVILMFLGILMFIISGFTKNHIVYLVSILMTGTSVFLRRIPSLLTDFNYIDLLSKGAKAAEDVKTYCIVRLILDILILAALVLLLVVWIISLVKDGKVKKGTGDPDKSLVFGFIPGLVLILCYVILCFYDIIGAASRGTLATFLLVRMSGSPWMAARDANVFLPLGEIFRLLFLGFQFGLLILFTGLWLNRPYKKLSAEEKAKAALAAKKAAEPAQAQTPYGNAYGQQYGQLYGAPYGQQYGGQMNQQYGGQMNQQYGQPYNQQYGAPYGQQYGAQMNQQYGQPYNPQYGAPYVPQPEPQPAAQPEPQPVPVPVPVFQENKAEEVPEKFEEAKEAAPQFFEEVKEEAAEKFEEVKEEAPQFFEEAKEEAAEKFEEVKEEVPQFFEEAKEEAAEKFEEVKEGAPQFFEEAKEEAVEKFEEVKEEAAEKFEEVKEELPRIKFCPNCGTPITGGRFCPGCGYKLFD